MKKIFLVLLFGISLFSFKDKSLLNPVSEPCQGVQCEICAENADYTVLQYQIMTGDFSSYAALTIWSTVYFDCADNFSRGTVTIVLSGG